jgi:hypothetical protein
MKALFSFLTFCTFLYADHVTLKNGDRLTGSVFRYDGKALTLKHEFAGTLAWQFTISDRFLSNPVAGRKKNHIPFTTGLRFTFAK